MKTLKLTQEEINTIWRALEGKQDWYEQYATEEEKETFKKLHEQFSLLEKF